MLTTTTPNKNQTKEAKKKKKEKKKRTENISKSIEKTHFSNVGLRHKQRI